MESWQTALIFIGALLSSTAAEVTKRAFTFVFEAGPERRADVCGDICERIQALQENGEALWSKSAQEHGSNEYILSARIIADIDDLAYLLSENFTGSQKIETDLILMEVIESLTDKGFQEPTRRVSPESLIEARRSTNRLIRFTENSLR